MLDRRGFVAGVLAVVMAPRRGRARVTRVRPWIHLGNLGVFGEGAEQIRVEHYILDEDRLSRKLLLMRDGDVVGVVTIRLRTDTEQSIAMIAACEAARLGVERHPGFTWCSVGWHSDPPEYVYWYGRDRYLVEQGQRHV